MVAGAGIVAGCDRGPARASAAVVDSAAPASSSLAVATSASTASASPAPSGAPSGEAIASSAPPVAPASAAPVASASASAADEVVGPKNLTERSIDLTYRDGPQFFTPAFDGSQRFSLWLEVMRFARAEAKRRAEMPHFTFFVNACYYSTAPGPSEIGRARSQGEVLVRRALTQLAINDGHDVGSHGVGHQDGRAFTDEAWRDELDRFDEIMMPQLFQPIRDDDGKAVFPRFAPLADAERGQVGAACEKDDDCASGTCAEITDDTRLCTTGCNLKNPCPAGTFCGAPMFVTDTDICLPKPVFPVEHAGKTLFFANGAPNFKHPALRPYVMMGYRAPFLASNDALYVALLDHGYRYDTSLAGSPRPPFALSPPGDSRALLEFPLMPHPGARAIPMDYNYRLLKVTPERMQRDYEGSLVSAAQLGKIPWNVGHHFATWDDGAYLKVLESTVRFALDGCPDDQHEARCPGTRVVSFRDLLGVLEARGGVPASFRATRRKATDAAVTPKR
jgi:hypothetical protein